MRLFSILLLLTPCLLLLLLVMLKKYRAAVCLSSISLLLFYLTANGVLPALLLACLQKPFLTPVTLTWQSHNVIVLLGGGAVAIPGLRDPKPSVMAYPRMKTAARLYHACHSVNRHCEVMVSGAESIFYRPVLEQLGVSPQDIRLETRSLNTYQNALFTSTLLKKSPYDYVVLVTSGYHLQRALYQFDRFGVHPVPYSADHLRAQVSFMPSARNLKMMRVALHEYLGMAQAFAFRLVAISSCNLLNY